MHADIESSSGILEVHQVRGMTYTHDLVLDSVFESCIEAIDERRFVPLDILAQALEFRNVLGYRGRLLEGLDCSFRRGF